MQTSMGIISLFVCMHICVLFICVGVLLCVKHMNMLYTCVCVGQVSSNAFSHLDKVSHRPGILQEG